MSKGKTFLLYVVSLAIFGELLMSFKDKRDIQRLEKVLDYHTKTIQLQNQTLSILVGRTNSP